MSGRWGTYKHLGRPVRPFWCLLLLVAMSPYGFLQDVVGDLDVYISCEVCCHTSRLTTVYRWTRFEVRDQLVGTCQNSVWWRKADTAVRCGDEALNKDEVAIEPLVSAGVGWTRLATVPADRNPWLMERAPVGPHITEGPISGHKDAVNVAECIGVPSDQRADEHGSEKSAVGFDP
jgi:hypothetical protein